MESPRNEREARVPFFVIRVPKRLAFSVIACALALGLGEVGQRVSDWRKLSRREARWDLPVLETTRGVHLTDRSGGVEWRLHANLLYENVPDQRNPRGTINRRGFRGPDWPVNKPEGTRRVVVVGGSVVYGWGAPGDDAVFTALLGEKLRARGAKVQVLNAGVIGYDSAQELILVESELLGDSPDLVVVFDGWNDFHNAGRTPPEQKLGQFRLNEVEEVIHRGRQVGRNVLRLSALYRGLEERVNDWRVERASAVDHDFGVFFDHPDALPRYRRNLRQLCQLAGLAGARTLLCTQPEISVSRASLSPERQAYLEKQQGRGYVAYARARYPLYVAAGREVAQATGATHDDATTLFDAVAEPVFLDEVHLTERGNDLVAEHLVPLVEHALGLPGAPAPEHR